MSTSTVPAGTLDISGTRRVSLATVVKVEMRKMADTRAGLWLLITIAAITAIVLVIFWFAANQDDRTIFNLMGITATPQGFLLPVLGILLVTQEWGQRTGIVTFTLEPSRGKVILAKVLAASIFALGAVALAFSLGAIAAGIGGAADPFADFSLRAIVLIAMVQVLNVLIGIAFGLLFLNSPAAIVLYFVLPTAIAIVTNLVSWLQDVAPWVDGSSMGVIYEGGTLTGQQWGQTATYIGLWLLLPAAVGLWRVMRAEVK